MNKLTRQQLELINRRTIKYPLQIAEKDYFLALAIQLIYKSSLGRNLVFKGGTAIHHCFLQQRRFSEDLDFTSLDPSISLDEVTEVLESDGTFQVNKTYDHDFTIKIEKLQYQGLLGQPGNIKVDVDHKQNVVLPGVTTRYQNVWNVEAAPLVMDQKEICAEKIRAISQRARYRDFYDLYFLLTELVIDLDLVIGILEQKEIRIPVIFRNIVENWVVAKEQMKGDLGNIFVSEEIPTLAIETLIRGMKFPDIEKNQ